MPVLNPARGGRAVHSPVQGFVRPTSPLRTEEQRRSAGPAGGRRVLPDLSRLEVGDRTERDYGILNKLPGRVRVTCGDFGHILGEVRLDRALRSRGGDVRCAPLLGLEPQALLRAPGTPRIAATPSPRPIEYSTFGASFGACSIARW